MLREGGGGWEGGGILARDTSCGLLDLSGTRRSACYKTPGK